MGMSDPSSTFDTYCLMVGEVKEIIYPTDNNSLSKTVIEYRVDVQTSSSNGPPTMTTYPHCVIANMFGGAADKFVYTLRADPRADPENILTSGSKVLLLCANGDQSRAYIVGGVRDDKVVDSKEDGHCLTWEFNGVNINVNKDGELRVLVKGPTDAKGAVTEGGLENGTTIQVSKDGNIKLSTAEDKHTILVDNTNQKIDIKTTGTVNIESSATNIGNPNASEALMLGTTYRADETIMDNQLIAGLTTLSALLANAGAALAAVATAHATPVAGPVAAAPLIAAAAAALTSAGPVVAQMQAAITTFEAKAIAHTSKKNKSD